MPPTYIYRGEWDANFIYDNNLPSGTYDVVEYQGALWKAEFYNIGENPMNTAAPPGQTDGVFSHGGYGPGYTWTLLSGEQVSYDAVVPSWSTNLDLAGLQLSQEGQVNLRAGYVSDTSANLFWNAAIVRGVGIVNSYTVYMTDTSTGIKTLAGTTTSTNIGVKGLEAGHAYTFEVVANDLAGSSGTQTQTGHGYLDAYQWDQNPGKGANPTVTVTTHGEELASTKYFSPYVDMGLPSSNIVTMAAESHVRDFTLAFMLSSTDVDGSTGHYKPGSIPGVSWGGVTRPLNTGFIADQIDQVQKMGSNVTVSFGGYSGREPALIVSEYEKYLDDHGKTAAQAHSAALKVLTDEYRSVINTYHVHSLDFDIEQDFYGKTDDQGRAVNADGDTVEAGSSDQFKIEYEGPNGETVPQNMAANLLRDEAIVALENADPTLKISYTLAVLPTGLTADDKALLLKAQDHGVRIDVVNIMAMDYDGPRSDMGQDAIDAAKATHQWLEDYDFDVKVGITPMIGNNDVHHEVFTLEDAEQVEQFAAQTEWVAGLGMWELPRDHDGTPNPDADPQTTNSGIDQDDWEFSHIFDKVTKLATAGDDLIQGDEKKNVLRGLAGNDTIKGFGSDDTIQGGAGKDSIDGGDGSHDLADYSDKTKAVVVTLNTSSYATVKVNGSSEDKIKNIENLAGGSAGDTLTGDSKSNKLIGNAGNDKLIGGSGGNDTLAGGTGQDTLTGGSSNDRFVFNTKLNGSDFDDITDFSHGHDKIQLENAVMSKLGTNTGTLSDSTLFYHHAGATNASNSHQHIVYDDTSGKLYYDSNGNSSGGTTLLAILDPVSGHAPTLTYNDIQII